MPFTRAHAKKFTPSPPSRPTTPASQKPAYMAAHTPTPSRIKAINVSSTPARQACGLLNLSLSSASASRTKKRGRSSLGNVLEVSPLAGRKKSRLSTGGIEDGDSFAVEVGEGGRISPLQLEEGDPFAGSKIPNLMDAMAKAMAAPSPRRRGRPPKKATSKPTSPEKEKKPTPETNEVQETNDRSHDQTAEIKPQTDAGDKNSPEHPSRLQELISKLDDSENATEAAEISNSLTEIIESSSTSELAASMAHLKAPAKVRQKIFICIIVALLGKGATENKQNA
ncbi:hypothetical protein TWF481_008808 [Arthrobotrys musiformis]|uniref:Wings apart-like protein C-terminal domain-containing protein n=1 Tax=Arthrobotrys musiformis TaxID=47236 RepID=A0AAV9W898_9PEZI